MAEVIQGSVGKNGKNNAEDVAKIRALLRRHSKWAGNTAADGVVDEAMIKAIKNFQETAASAGYATVVEFVDAMCESTDKHLAAFVSFIKNDATLKAAIKAKDWAKFAKGYNGADYAKNSYDTKMETAYNKFKPKPAKVK